MKAAVESFQIRLSVCSFRRLPKLEQNRSLRLMLHAKIFHQALKAFIKVKNRIKSKGKSFKIISKHHNGIFKTKNFHCNELFSHIKLSQQFSGNICYYQTYILSILQLWQCYFQSLLYFLQKALDVDNFHVKS